MHAAAAHRNVWGRRAVVGVVAAIAVAAITWWFRGPDAETDLLAAEVFVGSASCAACHAQEHTAWSASQHALAMQLASEESVLGQFDGAAVTTAGDVARFFGDDGQFRVSTGRADAQAQQFEVRYTFGVEPLQQYLIPLADGRLQAFGLAWDTREAASGGQRWFHLYPDASLLAGDRLHWTGIDQNWNFQCADCHSTNVRKNYDATTRRFDTTWSEISVGCEACHGPGSNHVAWATNAAGWRALEDTRGLTVALDERRGIVWTPQPTGTAQRSTPRAGEHEIETCARCHARRSQFSDTIKAGDDWLDAFRPALLEPPNYHADGQQREEVYTWGSFVQSRMHAAGVTCADCHEPHSQELRAPGNAVCAQCHAPTAFDTAAHHHHQPSSPGAACVGCHMPTTTYMVVDPRHDHSLRIPRPDRTVTLGTPNACNTCHTDRDAEWAAAAVDGWYPERKPGFQQFAEVFAAADRGDPAAAEGLAALMRDAQQPALVRASAVARGGRLGTPSLVTPIAAALRDPDALVRATAADALALVADPAARANLLAPLLTDTVRLVRMSAARALVGAPQTLLSVDGRARFTTALAEWVAAEQFNADRPEAQANLGVLRGELGALDAAASHFREALALDPKFAPATVNLADLERARGNEAGAEQLLRAALERDPAAAVIHHALGLSLVRQGERVEAVAALGTAHELAPDDALFAYVYAVALHDTGQREAAIDTLTRAAERHPYDRSVRQALADYEAEAR